MAEADNSTVCTTMNHVITVLCVDDDPDYLALVETAFDDEEDVEVLVETNPSAALDRLDCVDCVVSDFSIPELDGLEFLEAVRDRRNSLPFILHTGLGLERVGDTLLAQPCTDYLQKGWEEVRMELLGRRIRHLVERCQLLESTNRYAAAVESSREPTLIVHPDDTVWYANRRLSSEFTCDRCDLEGRPWTELFTDESVDRLRTEALPVAAEGWNWTGESSLRPRDGVVLSARTSLVQLEDGSKVFVFHGFDRSRRAREEVTHDDTPTGPS